MFPFQPSYLLIPAFKWTNFWEGPTFQIGDRPYWTLKLNVARMSPSGSVSVAVETSVTGDSLEWRPLHTFGPITSEGLIEDEVTLENPETETFLRGRIVAISGEVVLELKAYGEFFDLEDEDQLGLLSHELRTWESGRDQVIKEAEEEVFNLLLVDPSTGELAFDLSLPGATDAIRREIVRQAEHNMRRAVLARSQDPSALVSLRSMTRGAPGLGDALRKYRYGVDSSRVAWLGRG